MTINPYQYAPTAWQMTTLLYPTHPYQPTPPAWLELKPPVRVSGRNRVTLVPACVAPPAHDPDPGRPWWLHPADQGFWALPWRPMPGLDLFTTQARQIASQMPPPLRHDPRTSWKSAMAWVWEACSEACAAAKIGKKDPEAWTPAGLYTLLPELRWQACVRVSPKAMGPASLARALGRLRTICAMVDPEDEADPFWIRRVKTWGDFLKGLDTLRLQVHDGAWADRETREAGRLGPR